MRSATKLTTTITLLSLTLAPLVTAGWTSYGGYEPNTEYDDETWMWQEPATTPGRIYLNVISNTMYQQQPVTQYGDPSINPNVGALRTQIEPVASEYHIAFFGVWLDCNRDGYVGMAETAVREYDAALLLDDSLCPATTGSHLEWKAGAHNYRDIVTEFIPIARDPNGMDMRIYEDDEARLWGDFHRPDERPYHRSCTLRPFARGTTTDTGGFLNYVDCRYDVIGAWNDAMALVDDPAALRFANEDDARTGRLGGIPLIGNEHSSNAAVYTSDCSGEGDIHSGDLLNLTPVGPLVPPDMQPIVIHGPDPRTGDLESPTLGGQFNQTNEEIFEDCDTSNDFGHDLSGMFETDFNGVDPNNKLEADWNFGFTSEFRGGTGTGLVPRGYGGTAGISRDAGIAMGGSRWESDSTWLSKLGPRTVRLDLENGGATIAPAYWLTFYAHVGQATLDRKFALPGGSGEYGSWHCDGAESGIRNGWNCDGSIWYANPDGTFIPDPEGELARPGWPYELRDVDCYDGRIGAVGVGVQPAYYGDEPCA